MNDGQYLLVCKYVCPGYLLMAEVRKEFRLDELFELPSRVTDDREGRSHQD